MDRNFLQIGLEETSFNQSQKLPCVLKHVQYFVFKMLTDEATIN
jgi:hypothetical protein